MENGLLLEGDRKPVELCVFFFFPLQLVRGNVVCIGMNGV